MGQPKKTQPENNRNNERRIPQQNPENIFNKIIENKNKNISSAKVMTLKIKEASECQIYLTRKVFIT